jgi:hypothetical protein
LDSLLSPQEATFTEAANPRISIAESELSDISLDEEKLEDLKADSVDDSPSPLDLELEAALSSASTHKKSASLTTIHSGRHISLLVNREEQVQANRGSVDGQHKLQEEFARLQKGKEDGTDNQSGPLTPGVNAGIDWGE